MPEESSITVVVKSPSQVGIIGNMQCAYHLYVVNDYLGTG